jgi:hypothetical protein
MHKYLTCCLGLFAVLAPLTPRADLQWIQGGIYYAASTAVVR